MTIGLRLTVLSQRPTADGLSVIPSSQTPASTGSAPSSRNSSRPQAESPFPADSYWQQEVNYTIDVSLNDTEHTLDGFVRMSYANNSPDTLSFIWIHLWPNACKNDLTAFSEQLLGNGRTDFYFSDKDKKGYINHLDFRVEGSEAKMEDHPRYIDIIKVILPHPLLPGARITITTPFHEQLPYPFSGNGYNKGNYQIAQWIPQPAVYDSKGWHEMPFLDQGQPYNEYGSFDVRITLPKNYIVTANGERQASESGMQYPITNSQSPGSDNPINSAATSDIQNPTSKIQNNLSPIANIQDPKSKIQNNPSPTSNVQTVKFNIQNSNSFTWFASRNLRTKHDTLQLASGRVINVYAYFVPEQGPPRQNGALHRNSNPQKKNALHKNNTQHKNGAAPNNSVLRSSSLPNTNTIQDSNSIQYIKETVRSRAALLGEYPFNTISIVIPPHIAGTALRYFIGHEIGYNWLKAALGANGRNNPWMIEGLSAYLDRRYQTSPYFSQIHNSTSKIQNNPQAPRQMPGWLKKKLPEDPDRLLINTFAKEKQDQPITTAAEDFTLSNYHLIAQSKTALWLQQMESSLGTELFDSCIREYFRRWSFRHPYPEDFRTVMENTSHRDLSAAFALLDKKGPVTTPADPKKLRLTFLFSARNTDKISYINIGPVAGYNTYDHWMVGAVIHNFDLPPNAFQFLLAPLYATNSHQLNGVGYLGYSLHPDTHFQKISFGLEGAKFSSRSGNDSSGHQLFGGFYKIAPSLRLILKNQTARSTMQKWIEWKTFLIGEKELTDYVQKSTDSLSYPSAVGKYKFRYLNQASLYVEDHRVLYPYNALLQIQQGDRFYRVNFTGNYFFNYTAGGGMDLRFFAAKFGYIGGRNSSLDLSVYQPKLTGVSGSEDYTYSNYFVGRNEFSGLASQQIMIRDGGLKIRVPSFPWLEGKSDNWVSSLNLSSTLPYTILPRWMPLKVFLDIGTYADAWQDNPPTSRFLYTAGLQLSLFHNILNIYAPLVYSSDFRDQLKTLPDQNTFWKKLSFSIDIQNIRRHSGHSLADFGHAADGSPFAGSSTSSAVAFPSGQKGRIDKPSSF